jgi:hypothetical protein
MTDGGCSRRTVRPIAKFHFRSSRGDWLVSHASLCDGNQQRDNDRIEDHRGKDDAIQRLPVRVSWT